MNKEQTSLSIITFFFFKFGVEVGLEESIVNAPPDYKSDQLFKSNLTFCVVWVFKTSGSFNGNFDAKFIEKHPLRILHLLARSVAIKNNNNM
jgi:hypothetical protein